jgi:hypothetical protein
VALVAGGGVLAFAGWTSRSTSETFTIQAAGIPQMARPTVTGALVPTITWKQVRLTDGTAVDRYVVTRHLGEATTVVCSQPATLAASCSDPTALPGEPFTYTVRATHGEHWVGAHSEPSLPVELPSSPAPTEPSSTPVTPSAEPSPSPTGTATVDGAGPLTPETTPPRQSRSPSSPSGPEPTTDPAESEPAPVTPEESPTPSGDATGLGAGTGPAAAVAQWLERRGDHGDGKPHDRRGGG